MSTPPTNLSATALTINIINISWSEPTSFNGILHDYKIRYKISYDASYVSPISVGRQMNYTVNDLRQFTRYDFQVSFPLSFYAMHLFVLDVFGLGLRMFKMQLTDKLLICCIPGASIN